MAVTTTGKKWILGLVFTGTVVGITTYIVRQFRFLYKAGTRLAGAKIHNLGISNIKFTIGIELENKGDISANVTDQKYDIYIGNVLISSISNKTKVHINSNSSSVIPLTIELSPQNILLAGLQNMSAILNDKSKFVFNIKGVLSFNAGLLTMKDYILNMSFSLQEIVDMANSTPAPVPTV